MFLSVVLGEDSPTKLISSLFGTRCIQNKSGLVRAAAMVSFPRIKKAP
ncbi:unnamed protein product [Linum tenue]|uniref:Uncharacterized protein n=1 Tax=Linum tenue TaxID=586396 RepID=A0AAV0Q1V2_9ROSI|nr:unnamed protein product [Linum tenue]